MGGTNSSIQYRVWPKGTSKETTSSIFDRRMAIPSYREDELLSLGTCNIDIFNTMFDRNFQVLDKGQNYSDAKRGKYSDNEKCCLTTPMTNEDNGVIFSCSSDTKKFTNTFCDEILREKCVVPDGNVNCPVWIRASVQRNNEVTLNLFTRYAMDHFDDPYSKAFIIALRDFAADSNNFNEVADNILSSYSDQIKNDSLKCAFPSKNILDNEERINTPIECWYRECVITTLDKLLTKNIIKRNECVISVCDVNISKLNISNQDILISCKNQFKKTSIDIVNNPIKKDLDTNFFIPDVRNTTIPILFLFGLFLVSSLN